MRLVSITLGCLALLLFCSCSKEISRSGALSMANEHQERHVRFLVRLERVDPPSSFSDYLVIELEKHGYISQTERSNYNATTYVSYAPTGRIAMESLGQSAFFFDGGTWVATDVTRIREEDETTRVVDFNYRFDPSPDLKALINSAHSAAKASQFPPGRSFEHINNLKVWYAPMGYEMRVENDWYASAEADEVANGKVVTAQPKVFTSFDDGWRLTR